MTIIKSKDDRERKGQNIQKSLMKKYYRLNKRRTVDPSPVVTLFTFPLLQTIVTL